MSSSTLFRLSGVALIVGSLLGTLGFFLWRIFGSSFEEFGSFRMSTDLLLLASFLVLLIGLPGMYAYQAHRAGRLGLVSFVMVFLGLAAHEVSTAPLTTFVPPLLASRPETQALVAQPDTLESELGTVWIAYYLTFLLIYYLGIVVLGVATLRARVFPRWAAVLLIAGPLLGILGGAFVPVAQDVGLAAIVVGWVWCGYALVAGKTGAKQATPQAGGAPQPTA
jgi:hypothetical protein